MLNYIGYNQWPDVDPFPVFVEKVMLQKWDKVIIFGQNEWAWHYHDPHYWHVLLAHLKKIGQPLHVITASHKHLYPIQVENTVIDWWDSYWLGKSYGNVIRSNPAGSIDPKETVSYKYHFICMNGRPHPHRLLLIDLLAKYNLIKKNAVSVHYENLTSYQWRHFNYRKILLEPEFADDWNAYRVPVQYRESFAQLISESSGDTIIMSEKTAIALIMGKPFLVSGQMHYHKFLKGLGFALYDEIFDYSFDDEPVEEKRYEMLLENFRNLVKIPLPQLSDLQKKIQHKVNFNKKRARNIIYDLNLYPALAHEIIDYYNQTGIAIDRRLVDVHNDLLQFKTVKF